MWLSYHVATFVLKYYLMFSGLWPGEAEGGGPRADIGGGHHAVLLVSACEHTHPKRYFVGKTAPSDVTEEAVPDRKAATSDPRLSSVMSL